MAFRRGKLVKARKAGFLPLDLLPQSRENREMNPHASQSHSQIDRAPAFLG